jgi:hypothetical protein
VHTVRRFIRQHALSSVLALLVALLWSVGWGQVHRVLHPGAGTSLAAPADSQTAAPGMAHEDGSGLCQLLDHLSDGAGPVQAVATLALAQPPSEKPRPHLAPVHLLALRGFDARGPPTRT